MTASCGHECWTARAYFSGQAARIDMKLHGAAKAPSQGPRRPVAARRVSGAELRGWRLGRESAAERHCFWRGVHVPHRNDRGNGGGFAENCNCGGAHGDAGGMRGFIIAAAAHAVVIRHGVFHCGGRHLRRRCSCRVNLRNAADGEQQRGQKTEQTPFGARSHAQGLARCAALGKHKEVSGNSTGARPNDRIYPNSVHPNSSTAQFRRPKPQAVRLRRHHSAGSTACDK